MNTHFPSMNSAVKVAEHMIWDREAQLLEEQFLQRGLQFTTPIEGLSLMQAYGYLDGKRFYFHLRDGVASLCVGVYDRAVEVSKAHRRNATSLHADSANTADTDTDVKTRPALEIPQEEDQKLFPSVVMLESHLELDQRRLTDLFAALIDTLKPVKASWN